MKQFLTSIILLFIITISYSQEFKTNPGRNSIIDIGIGAGPNYGIIGVKTVIGYKGSGLLIGTGMIQGMFAYEIGVQINPKWFFFNVGYGVYGILEQNYYHDDELLSGLIIEAGFKFNMNKSKKIFLEFGVGYTSGKDIDIGYGYTMPSQGISGVIGIGYRVSIN